MNDNNILSIIDFGSTKLRLGVFANHLTNSKYICDENIIPNSKNEINKSIKNIILKTEREIGRHLNKTFVMLDSHKFLSIDVSIKKKTDQININENIIKQFIQEIKVEIERNYKYFKILHIVISRYVLDDKEFNNLPKNTKVNNLIIDIKFILTPNEIIDDMRELFKDNQTSISNIFCSTYIKTLNYLKYFDKFDTKVFIDIGSSKTSLIIYKYEKLKYINYIPIGGEHITKDISNVLKISLDESENIKKKLNQTNANLNNNEDNSLIIKVVHARIEEIIDLSFQTLESSNIFLKQNSILIFTGNGSKILSKNSIFLKEKYNIFDQMSFFEENSDLICSSGHNYLLSEKKDEAILSQKKRLKRGIFEKLFYIFSK